MYMNNDYLEFFNKNGSLIPIETELDMFSVLSGRTMGTAKKGEMTQTISLVSSSKNGINKDLNPHLKSVRDYNFTPNIKPNK